MGIEEILTLNISRETTAIRQAGFGIGMFLAAHKRTTTRQLSVTEADQVLDAGFLTTDAAYIAAQKYFSQERKPTSLTIGRRDSDDAVTLTFDAPVAGKVYTITVNGEVLTFTATVTETTAALVAAAFEAANAAGFTAAAITFDDTAADGTAIIAPTVAGTDYTIHDEANITYTATYSETLTDALNEITNEQDDFYFVMSYSHVKADQLELAAAIEAVRKVYMTTSSDTVIVDSTEAADVTSVAKALKDGNFFRTHCLYSAVADTQYPEAAQVGEGAPTPAGSRQWAMKTLAGITQDNLSPAQIANAKNKNCSVYTRINDVPVVRDVKTAGGEWLDIIRGVDWLHARISERYFTIQVNSEKIPYTDAGIAIIVAEIYAQREEGIARDFLSGSLDDTVTFPKVKDVSFADKASRTLNNVEFEFELAGAILYSTINGVVTA